MDNHEKYDVAIVGGGFSGVAAALAAAREGASVLLVEKGNCLGGAAAHCLVNPFMYYSTKIDGFVPIWLRDCLPPFTIKCRSEAP